MYVQTQTLAEMAPSKDSIDPEDPTTTWVTTKSILLSETFPMEFTTGGTSSREIVKVKYLTLFLVRYTVYTVSTVSTSETSASSGRFSSIFKQEL